MFVSFSRDKNGGKTIVHGFCRLTPQCILFSATYAFPLLLPYNFIRPEGLSNKNKTSYTSHLGSCKQTTTSKSSKSLHFLKLISKMRNGVTIAEPIVRKNTFRDNLLKVTITTPWLYRRKPIFLYMATFLFVMVVN